jgi:CubicO group peptidase (beta-lactamase class C family)
MLRRTACALLLALPCALAQAQTAAAHGFQPVWPGTDWQAATPEEMGMDSRSLATFVEYGGNTQMDSLFVTRWGRVVAQAYYAPFEPGMKHRVNSTTKAIIGALAGIAVGQGKLDANARMVSFFADRRIAALDDAKRAITVQQLLHMTSGLAWKEPLSDALPESMIAMERSGDWVQYVLDRPMAHAPGTAFDYNSGSSHLVSAIIARATGLPARDFAAKHLFAPIGITDTLWRQDPQGVNVGGYGLYLRTADMARIGYLYLHRGQWNGQQVIPRAWADKVFDANIAMFPTGGWKYADGWWTLPSRKAYLTVGYNRQLIIVLPEQGIVAAVTGRRVYPIENVIDHLQRSVRAEAPLPPDPSSLEALQAAVAEAAATKPWAGAVPAPAVAREVEGKTFAFAPNEWGWKELAMRFEGTPTMDLVVYISRANSNTRKVTLPLGMEGGFAMGDSPEGRTALRGAWTDANTLSVALRVPQETIARMYKLHFDGPRLDVEMTNSLGKTTSISGRAK